MLTHVKDLTEALARFNPLARLSQPLVVDGPSPATDCLIGLPGDIEQQERMETLEGALHDAEENAKQVEEQFKSIKDTLSKITDLMNELQSAIKIIDERNK